MWLINVSFLQLPVRGRSCHPEHYMYAYKTWKRGSKPLSRVLMGLTDRRKRAKNLVDSRKNGKILTVSRKWGKKELTVKEIVPRFVIFKEGDKIHLWLRLFIPRLLLLPYARWAKLLLGVDLDLGSISAAHSNNQVFSIGKIWLLAED